MTTAPAPTTKETRQPGPPIAHRVCIYCFPQTPAPGDIALCGHVCLGIRAHGEYQCCVVCEELFAPHCNAHRGRCGP
ncbi:hypothetical protein [Streptomyces venezuelae]|uniref:hypothetical protein n=1 Tax=Streptomyces venezuelae TaxID=54571 RepID=UPI00123AA93F|nr:hypothetical protein [Streptomyces venezuelae]